MGIFDFTGLGVDSMSEACSVAGEFFVAGEVVGLSQVRGIYYYGVQILLPPPEFKYLCVRKSGKIYAVKEVPEDLDFEGVWFSSSHNKKYFVVESLLKNGGELPVANSSWVEKGRVKNPKETFMKVSELETWLYKDVV